MTRIIALSARARSPQSRSASRSYALVSPGGSKTVVRQVTVAGGTPTAVDARCPSPASTTERRQGVVEITVVDARARSRSAASQAQQAQGSGFVYDGDGHIVTTSTSSTARARSPSRFWNGATYKATLVGTDPSTDLAVIKVDAPASMLHPLALGDSSAVQVGQGVVAIGSPFGLEETVTAGIVSALHREMTAPNNFTIADSIQTDARDQPRQLGRPAART